MEDEQKKNKKILLTIVGVAIVMVALVGVTYAFFNYTRTGGANTVRTGRILFNTTEGENINLTNAFPVASGQATDSNPNVRTLSITVTGDTDYADGLEYLVTATDVHMTTLGNKEVPLKVVVSVSDIATGENAGSLGTEESGNYFANKASYKPSGNTPGVNKYKVLYTGNDAISEGERLLVGYIAPNTTPGTASGVSGIIKIKVYFDGDRIAISDTYNETTPETDEYGTTTSWVRGREVFTTSEWNAISSNGLSFKVKVEANEGQWVPSSATPAVQTAAEYLLANATLEETPYGYVYSGANVDNYVTFNGGLWRILGVYGDKIKIISTTPIASQTYNAPQSDGNVWGGSRLEQYLNQDTEGGYYYSLSSDAKNMIADGSWDVGVCGHQIAAATAYECARTTNPYNNVTYTTPLTNKKVGLIATYEYLYAAESTCWTTTGYDYDGGCGSKDWLFSTLTNNGSSDAWTLSPYSDQDYGALFVNYGGDVGNRNVYSASGASPVVYLKSGVTITGGKGQLGTPYTLAYSGS